MKKLFVFVLMSIFLATGIAVAGPTVHRSGVNIMAPLEIDHTTETLSADRTVLLTDKPILWFDCDGTSRNVTLPAEASNSTDLTFTIVNISDGAGENLVIRDDTPTTLITVGPGQGARVSCDGTSWKVHFDSGIYYDAVSGNRGIGVTDPDSLLQLMNDHWLSAKNFADAAAINMFKVNVSDEIDLGATLNGGALEFSADSGAVTALDMPVSATPTAGAEESYVNKIDGNSIFGIRSQADSSGGIFGLGTQLSGGIVTTTDATVTTLDYITLDDESAYTITATITAKQNNSDQRSSFIMAGLFYRNGGNATQQGATTVIQAIESDAATACVFDVNGNDVRVRVTGIAAETWNWECHFEIMIQD